MYEHLSHISANINVLTLMSMVTPLGLPPVNYRRLNQTCAFFQEPAPLCFDTLSSSPQCCSSIPVWEDYLWSQQLSRSSVEEGSNFFNSSLWRAREQPNVHIKQYWWKNSVQGTLSESMNICVQNSLFLFCPPLSLQWCAWPSCEDKTWS
jgi:hypothetical protein